MLSTCQAHGVEFFGTLLCSMGYTTLGYIFINGLSSTGFLALPYTDGPEV